jgi:cell wall-associated NlpC family hydrolase
MYSKWNLLFVLFMFPLTSSVAQVLDFDMLEMRYDQGHYKSVLRKANRLIDNPEYDYSYLPKYYKALSSLQLAKNTVWLKRNKNALNDATDIIIELRGNYEGRKILKSHVYELSSLKKDLEQWGYVVQIEGNTQLFEQIKKILDELFLGVPEIYDLKEDKEELEAVVVSTSNISEKRKLVLAEASKHLGTSYKWAGIDPKGFDCSGYTSYVLLTSVDKKIERRATDQYNSSKKLKVKNVEPGDLVFFDNGSGISHVGIIYSTEDGSIQMIHSSTSLGISIVDIYSSNYWKQRIAGFGTYLD